MKGISRYCSWLHKFDLHVYFTCGLILQLEEERGAMMGKLEQTEEQKKAIEEKLENLTRVVLVNASAGSKCVSSWYHS